jgi:hypothetical protein
MLKQISEAPELLPVVEARVRFLHPALVGARNYAAGQEAAIDAERAYELAEVGRAEAIDDEARESIREAGKYRSSLGRSAPERYVPSPHKPIGAERPDGVEVILKDPLLIDARHRNPGDRVRLDPSRAADLIDAGHATAANLMGVLRTEEARRRSASDRADASGEIVIPSRSRR